MLFSAVHSPLCEKYIELCLIMRILLLLVTFPFNSTLGKGEEFLSVEVKMHLLSSFLYLNVLTRHKVGNAPWRQGTRG